MPSLHVHAKLVLKASRQCRRQPPNTQPPPERACTSALFAAVEHRCISEPHVELLVLLALNVHTTLVIPLLSTQRPTTCCRSPFLRRLLRKALQQRPPVRCVPRRNHLPVTHIRVAQALCSNMHDGPSTVYGAPVVNHMPECLRIHEGWIHEPRHYST